MPSSSQYQPIDTYDLVAVIPTGQTTSQQVDLSGVDPCGLFLPAAFTGTALKFLAAPASDGTFLPLKDGSGNDYALVVSAGSYVIIPDLQAFAGVRWLRLVSSATEAADRSIVIAARPI